MINNWSIPDRFQIFALLKYLLVTFSALVTYADMVSAKSILPPVPNIDATSFVLIDANSQVILAEHNAEARVAPASLTKIMTALIVEEEVKAGRARYDEEAEISVRAWRTGGSKMFIREGTKVSIGDLLRGVIVQSGNDASIALAEHVAGGEAEFAHMMNEKARRLGLRDTNFVNATGAWSSQLFSKIGLKIPVTIEPVSVVNWMESPKQIRYEYPIIADYTNLCYFRSWRGNKMHAHQPRKRSVYEIAKNFLNDLTSVNGGEYLNEPMNQSLAYNQIKNYEDISKKRFSNIDKTVYASGYRSFFDITPDLRFILGGDSKFSNLFHNLGSGQAMKYCPVLGESIAEEIMNENDIISNFDYKKFSIKRFSDDYMKKFWNLVQGEENTLHRQGKNQL